jgi:hypothetical protein
VGKLVSRFEPRLTRQSASSLASLAQKVDENLLLLKQFSGDLTLNVNQVIQSFNITPGVSPLVGGMSFSFSDNDYNSPGGSELWMAERMCPFSDATEATLSLSLVALALSTSGLGTFRLRAGGTTHQPDGTLLASVTTGAPAFSPLTLAASAPNPGGIQLIKLTAQASGAGQKASIRSATVTIR